MKRFPFRIQVTAKEFFYTLSSRVAPPGAAVIEFVNYGEDPHDMRVQRAGGGRLYKTPVMQPGQYYDLRVDLVAGHYRPLVQHREPPPARHAGAADRQVRRTGDRRRGESRG